MNYVVNCSQLKVCQAYLFTARTQTSTPIPSRAQTTPLMPVLRTQVCINPPETHANGGSFMSVPSGLVPPIGGGLPCLVMSNPT